MSYIHIHDIYINSLLKTPGPEPHLRGRQPGTALRGGHGAGLQPGRRHGPRGPGRGGVPRLRGARVRGAVEAPPGAGDQGGPVGDGGMGAGSCGPVWAFGSTGAIYIRYE